MNDIAPRVASGLPPTALQGIDSAPITPSPAPDTKARFGTGPMSQRLIAVGDGQAAQRMHDGRVAQARLAGASPAVRAMLANSAAGPGPHGILLLKERQLGQGGGQGTA